MSRPLMIISIIVGLFVACFVALLVLLDNPSAYKKEISSAFQSQTGYGLEINGDINWQYFPPIAISLADVAVTTPKSKAPLASLTSASVDLKLFPLLFGGSVEVSGLSIDGLTVNAEVDASGKGNWEVSEAESTDSAPTDDSDTGGSGNNLSVDIGGIDITNAIVNYVDKSANSHIVLTLSQFRTGALGTGITTNIIGDLKFEDKISNLNADVALSGKAAINEALDKFTLENFSITSTVNQPESAPITSTILLNGLVNTQTGIANLNNSEMVLSDLKLGFGIEATEIFGATKINGKISAPVFNAKKLLAALDSPMPTENPDALTKVSFNADITGTLEQFTLSNLALNLDQSKLSGDVIITLGDKTDLGFNLTIDNIVGSDYLEPTTASVSAGSDANNAATAATIADSEVIPVSTLKDTNIDGTFTIASLQYETWAATNFKIKFKNRDQKLNVTGTGDAYTGSITFNVSSTYAGKAVNTTSVFTVTGIDITKALEFEAITGTLELDANHTFNGAMMSDLANSLNGKSSFSVANGTLDVTPIKKIAVIVDGLQGTQSGIAEWPDMLPFDFLKGDHNFKTGISKDQTLNASIENMRISGKGGVDYFANTVIYDLEATLLESAGQFKVNPKLTGVRFPVHCEGSMDAEVIDLCLPDRAAITRMVKDLATQEIKRKGTEAIKKKLEEQVPEELKEKAKGLLKGLFN